MKETGLMFKAPPVRTILSGQKTQTRRLVKPAPASDQPLQYITTETGLVYARSMEVIDPRNIRRIRWESPVGKPGDRIYVRETFVQGYTADPETGLLRQWDEDGDEVPMTTWYRATDSEIGWEDDDGWEANLPWRSSAQMPKDLARIWLEVTAVRVERLQDISEADAKAEGVDDSKYHGLERAYAREFSSLWESTGGDWAANPWVWVIDFKRIERELAAAKEGAQA